MTYEEAKICIKANICYKQEACADGICKSTEERPCAIDVVIELLEKQAPKKVVRKMGCHGGALCPNCRTMFEYRMDNWRSPFCQYCGQALEWEEVK